MSIVNEWPMVKLGEVLSLPSRWSRKDTKEYSYIDISSLDSSLKKVTDTQPISSKSAPSRATTHVIKDDVLVSTVRPNLNAVAMVPAVMADGIASSGIAVLRAVPDKINPCYLFHVTQSQFFIQRCCDLATGASYPAVSDAKIRSISIPLPPLLEQQRIAEILDASQQQLRFLETKRADLDSLKTESVDQVLDLNDRKTLPLKGIAEIQSGITKGRKVREGETLTETPYMAVSNVKDGHLDLQNVKTLPVTEAETTRFSLQAGDILLTEGGDPDKLGRGTVWREEIETCLHQNHIFRVRLPEDSQFTPEVLMAMLATKQARAYFFRSAKQTTGIASINKTQLSAVPVPVLTSEEIAKLSKILNQVDAITEDLEKRQESTEELHDSLSTRAFAGHL